MARNVSIRVSYLSDAAYLSRLATAVEKESRTEFHTDITMLSRLQRACLKDSRRSLEWHDATESMFRSAIAALNTEDRSLPEWRYNTVRILSTLVIQFMTASIDDNTSNLKPKQAANG